MGINRDDTSLSWRHAGWGLQIAGAGTVFEVASRRFSAKLATKWADTSPDRSGFVYAGKWEPMLKYRDRRIAALQPQDEV